MRYQRAEIPVVLDGVASARKFFEACQAEADPSLETLWVAHLDDKARCIHLSRHQGDARGVDFPLRTIVIDAAKHCSAAILVAHNHPSGDPQPSQSDLKATRRLATAADALGCELLDHFVFAGTDCRSMRRLGLL